MPNVLFAAVLFACGIAISSSAPSQSVTWLIPGVILAVLAAVARSNVSRVADDVVPVVRSILIALCVICMGAHRYSAVRSRLGQDQARLTHSAVRSIRATVSNYRSHGSYYSRVGLSVDSLCTDTFGLQCRQNDSGSAILVFADSVLADQLFPGVQIHVNERPTDLPILRNPGSFDYANFLRNQGYVAEIRISDRQAIVIDAGSMEHPSIVVRAQRTIRTNIRNHIPNDDARAMIVALMLGDRSGIDESIRDIFRTTGLMHLLAVSGLHVLVVGYSVYRMLGGLLFRIGVGWVTAERIRSAVTLTILLFYYLVAGQSVSIFRALIMATLFLAQHMLKRRALMLNGLGVAAIVVLFVNPTDLFSVGFQLSFGAVASLALLNPLPERFVVPGAWSRRISKRLRTLVVGSVRSMAASFAATIGTLPILVYHFGFVSFAGIILNLAAIPITASALSSGILSVLAGIGRLSTLADWLGYSAGFFTGLLIRVTTIGNDVLDSVAFAISPPGVLLSGLLFAALLFYGARRIKKIRWKISIVTGGLTVFLFVFHTLSKPLTLDIVFLDVGQGDAVLIATPEKRTMLIDTGPAPYRDGATSETIEAILNRWHSSSIDVLIHSHPHTDHIGGTVDVLERIAVSRIIDNGIAARSNAYRAYDSIAAIKNVFREVAIPGRLIHLSTTTTVEILAPTQTLLKSANLNEGSIVLRIVYGETCALLTGDIEAAAERSIVSYYRSDLHCSVIKIPHHGSNTSSAAGLVGRVMRPASAAGPSFAVVSVARKNRFGLPDREALDRWTSGGATVRSTQDGAVWLRSDGVQFREYDWRSDE